MPSPLLTPQLIPSVLLHPLGRKYLTGIFNRGVCRRLRLSDPVTCSVQHAEQLANNNGPQQPLPWTTERGCKIMDFEVPSGQN